MANHIKFEQTAFDTYNNSACQVIIDYVNTRTKGIKYCVYNKDTFCVDLMVYWTKDHRLQSGIEVEVKSSWHGYDFPYAHVHIPYRKGKLFDTFNVKYPNVLVWFMMLNCEMTHALMINSLEVKNSRVVTKPTKRHERPDVFYEVDRLKFQLINLLNGAN